MARPHEAMLYRQARKEYARLGNTALAALRRQPDDPLGAIEGPAVNHVPRMEKILRGNIGRAMRGYAAWQMKELGIEGGKIATVVRSEINAAIAGLAKGTSENLATRTGKWLSEGARMWTPDPDERRSAAEYLTERFKGDIADRRAKTVAQNVILQAASQAIDIVGEVVQRMTGGKLWKIWMSQRDNRVRESHRKVDGVAVQGRDGVFYVEREQRGGVDDMRHPRDPSASAENVINCRCFLRWSVRKPPGSKTQD